MTATIPTCEPTQFTAGDSVAWTRALASYPPSDGWTLHYRLVGPSSPLPSDPVVTVVDGVYSVALAASATANENFIPGTYEMTGWVDGVGSERHTVVHTYVEITPNLAVASFDSLQSSAQRLLDACDAALEGRLTNDVARYSREGTFVEKLAIADVLRIRGIAAARVHREIGGGAITHEIVFARPSRSASSDWCD